MLAEPAHRGSRGCAPGGQRGPEREGRSNVRKSRDAEARVRICEARGGRIVRAYRRREWLIRFRVTLMGRSYVPLRLTELLTALAF